MTGEKKYWKSLEELHDRNRSRELKENESGAAGDFALDDLPPISRKKFLALLSASAAFAVAGCSNYKDRGEIVPYSRKPEEVTPGTPNYYASTCDLCPQRCGILIKTREGRPVKIEGNPDHPVNLGKICAKGHSSVLNLYDPYRLRSPRDGKASGRTGDLSWGEADAEIIKSLEQASRSGKEIAIVTHPVYSFSAKKALDVFAAKYPGTKVYPYALFQDENRKRAWARCYGKGNLPVIGWEKARVILAIESDFLGTDGMTVEQTRKFAEGRDVMRSADFNRLYCVEGSMSLTGANADYRLRLNPALHLEFILGLAGEASRNLGAVNFLPPGMPLASMIEKFSLDPRVVGHLVSDLLNNRGRSIIHAGSALSEEIHIAVNYLNEILGNTAIFSASEHVEPFHPPAGHSDFGELTARMKSGGVGVVIHLDANPVYHLPGGFAYETALKSVPLSVSLVESEDETSRLSAYVLPINHAFESWGDHRSRSGFYSLQQPVISPLYDTRQKEEALLAWAKWSGPEGGSSYHDFMVDIWKREIYPSAGEKADFRSFWRSCLHDGVAEIGEPAGKNQMFDRGALASLSRPREHSGFTVALRESHFMGDGRLANNGWLQELPHPVSKIVWDNYAAISPKTAESLGLENNDLAEIELGHGKLTLPVFLQPGHADDFVSLELGYGRSEAGPIGTDVGVNGNLLLSKESLLGPRIFGGATVRKAGGKRELVSTQEHHSLDDEFLKDLHRKRKIIREGTLEEYRDDPGFLHKEKHELFNIAEGVEYDGVKWGMAIDLNKCTGCNACVAGCNVENNIPVVGKEQVDKGREMQWIRIDRYYSGTNENPSLSHQPMLCQHCDNAPCENVCPVVATNHSPDGLNQMVYNRCVGTKYCSNNCPYKVRRFNFFNWRDNLADGYYEEEPVSLLHNPEVTVRSRGVMEKCTFCIQRIMEARQHATQEGRAIAGTDVRTACEEACPATAIIFGDMNDPASELSRYRKHELGYSVLEEVNARPNVTYIARLRNTLGEEQL